ncbi:hypothetical protein KCV07_g63, partial [Aureobasidium melanogenum]
LLILLRGTTDGIYVTEEGWCQVKCPSPDVSVGQMFCGSGCLSYLNLDGTLWGVSLQGSSLSCMIKRTCSKTQGPGATSKYRSNLKVVETGIQSSDTNPNLGGIPYRQTQISRYRYRYSYRSQKAHLTHDIAFKNNRDDCLLFISRSEPTEDRSTAKREAYVKSGGTKPRVWCGSKGCPTRYALRSYSAGFAAVRS